MPWADTSMWATHTFCTSFRSLYKHQVIMFSSSKFSLKHTFKKVSSLILGNQLSLYSFPFKWTPLCSVCLRNSAGPQLLTPTYWGEVKKCDNCRSWQQSLRALWDKMSPDSFSTHWFPTKGMLLIPLPPVSINPDLSGCSEKMNWALPAKSTHRAVDQLPATVTLVLGTWNGDTGDTGVFTSPHSQLQLSCLCQPKKQDVTLGSGMSPQG